LDVLQTLPTHELPAATIPHEQEQLAERDREVAQAEAELQVAEGKLAQAKQEREYQEYQFSVTASNRELQMQQQELQREAQIQKREEQERTRDFQLAQITAQMQAIETQLAALSAVRSPYNAKIHRVKFDGQENQNLGVELTLVVSGKLTVPSAVPTSAARAQPIGAVPGAPSAE
jgi:DNA repair exonuclease SbcCD ATPase subunit